jgi:hypothetical protein
MLNRIDKKHSKLKHVRLSSRNLKTLSYINVAISCVALGFYLGQVVAFDGINFSEYPEIFPGGLALFGGIGTTLRIASKRKKKKRNCNPIELLNARANVSPVPLAEIIKDKS